MKSVAQKVHRTRVPFSDTVICILTSQKLFRIINERMMSYFAATRNMVLGDDE